MIADAKRLAGAKIRLPRPVLLKQHIHPACVQGGDQEVGTILAVDQHHIAGGKQPNSSRNSRYSPVPLPRYPSRDDSRRRMGEAGRKRVEEWYSRQVQAPRLIGMLKSLSIGIG